MKTILGNKKFIITISGILLITGVVYGGRYLWYSWHRNSLPLSQGPTMYTCSMHPQIMQDHPGNCPICGMTLIAMKGSHQHDAEGDHNHGANFSSNASSQSDKILIEIEPSVIQKMGVQTAAVKREPITREIRSVAHIDFAEDAEAVVNARFDGWVEKLYASITGQQVRRGQPLAAVYSPALLATQSEYLHLFRTVSQSPNNKESQELLQAARQRLQLWNITNAQIKALEKRGQPSRLMSIYAPISGVITEKNVVQGAKIKEGQDLFKIINLSQVWAMIHITENDIQFVKLGMPVDMIVPQLGEQVFHGKVNFIYPYLERQDRDLKVRVSFANPGYQLKPGMFATLHVKRTLPGQSLTIPSSAVIRTGTRELVFVYDGQGRFEPREITSGVSTTDNRIQVLAGLADGEAVVVSGQFLLDSETRIQEAVRKMRSSEANPMSGSDLKTDSNMGGHQH
ncbi:MAG: efflux RND transporter periplasmic adaptor subunit [Leptospiraceae bacterium]|nr:efflux RND transporter periplasmic adaptor subunit [Leptospiraceae bacterium]